MYACSGSARRWSAGPVSTISPRYITTTVSARSAARPRSWVMSRTLVPSSSVIASTVSRMRRCTVTSSADVGSSATSSRGRQASPTAMRARCLIPPENSCGYCAARPWGSGMPTRSSSSRARAQAALPFATSWTSRASATWSPIRITGSRFDIGSCGTRPMPAPRMRRISRSLRVSRSRPSSTTRPAVTRPLAGRSRFTAAAVVDFPEPDSPTSATVDPAGTVRETSRTAVWSPRVVPKTTVRPSIARIGTDAGASAVMTPPRWPR